MVYKPSILIKDGKMIPLNEMSKKDRDDFVKKATVAAMAAVGYRLVDEKN